jgi:hypothetical protein
VQFFASDAVGVGSSRSRSNSEGPPCLLVAETPFEEPSCAIGVGNTAGVSVVSSSGPWPDSGAVPGDHVIWTVRSIE